MMNFSSEEVLVAMSKRAVLIASLRARLQQSDLALSTAEDAMETLRAELGQMTEAVAYWRRQLEQRPDVAILKEKIWNVLAVCDSYLTAGACTPAELKALALAYEEIVDTGDGEVPGAEFAAQFKLEHAHHRIPRGPGDDPDGWEDSLGRAALRGEDV